jgi:7tm Chemosensory receptor
MLELNIKFNYQKLRWCLILYLVFIISLELVLMYFAYLVQHLFGKLIGIKGHIFIFWSINTLTMFLSQVILLILAIKQRFGAINFFLCYTPGVNTQQLRMISRVHLKLTDAIEHMNGSYCVMTMIFFGGAFCMFNFFLFSLKSEIIHFNRDRFIAFSGKVLLNFYSFVMTMSVILVASLTTKEAKKGVKVLFEVMHCSQKDSQLNELIGILIQQFSFSQVKFSCGLFVYDWKLWFKVISYRFTE